MRGIFYFLVPAGFFVVIAFALSQKLGPLPPLGPFLSFHDGVFAQYKKNANDGKKVLDLRLKGLEHPVEVILDEHLVPHIFAKSKKDLYRAQGYVLAKFRLWQMDMTTRVAGGQLAEVLGPKALSMDQFFVQMGLRESSKRALDEMFEDAVSKEAILAYVDGINQYIQSLSYQDWPLEYKAVHFRPQAFEPIRVAQLLKIMSFNLSGRSYDLALTEIVQKLGWKRSIEIFPDFFGSLTSGQELDDLFMEDTPSATSGRVANERLSYEKLISYPGFSSALSMFPNFLLPFQNDGSNSWAVQARKSATGNVILSNDTHLGLKAPAVWLENHLIVENSEDGDVNVYGASFPGAPGVILGFNKDFSWGATNGTIDVLDWYEIEFRDESSTDYLLDGRYVRSEVWEEDVKVQRQEEPVKVKVVWTEFGPVMHREGKLGLAFRWTAHEPSNELSVFLQMNEAKSVKHARAILKNYKNPIQNFTLADRQNISIFTAGLIPKRPVGQGRVVENGRFSKNNWSGYLNVAQNPNVEDPIKNFVHSANQRPNGPSFPSYLGWDFEEPFRGLRIRDILSASEKLSTEDFFKMQNESFNELAAVFFKTVDRSLVAHELTKERRVQFESIMNWDFLDSTDSVAPTYFYRWFSQVENKLWGEEFGFQKRKYFPKKAYTLKTLDALKRKSELDFYKFLADTFKKSMSVADLKWGQFQPTKISHVTRFPGLDAGVFYPNGSRYSLNSNKGDHGGAWRLVVEMSDPVRAWSQIPGSSEGDPLSPNYVKGISEWVVGKYKPVSLSSRSDLLNGAAKEWRLAP